MTAQLSTTFLASAGTNERQRLYGAATTVQERLTNDEPLTFTVDDGRTGADLKTIDVGLSGPVVDEGDSGGPVTPRRNSRTTQPNCRRPCGHGRDGGQPDRLTIRTEVISLREATREQDDDVTPGLRDSQAALVEDARELSGDPERGCEAWRSRARRECSADHVRQVLPFPWSRNRPAGA